MIFDRRILLRFSLQYYGLKLMGISSGLGLVSMSDRPRDVNSQRSGVPACGFGDGIIGEKNARDDCRCGRQPR